MMSRSEPGAEGRRATTAFFGALAAVAATLVAFEAGAEPPSAGFELSWHAPKECPQRRAVEAEARRLAGAAARQGPPLVISGRVVRAGADYRLQLSVRDGTIAGERTIEASSCDDLVGAAAVAIALLLQSQESQSEADRVEAPPPAASGDGASTPSSASRESKGRPSESTQKKAASQPSPSREADAERKAEQREGASRPWRVLLVLPWVGVDVGLMPKPSVSFGAAVGLKYDSWRAHVGGRFAPSQRVSVEDLPAYGADVERLTGVAAVCRGFRGDRLEIAPCLGLRLESVRVEGAGSHVVPTTQRASWISAGPGVIGSWYVAEWFALAAQLDVQLETARPRVSIENLGYVRRFGLVNVTPAVAAEWIF